MRRQRLDTDFHSRLAAALSNEIQRTPEEELDENVEGNLFNEVEGEEQANNQQAAVGRLRQHNVMLSELDAKNKIKFRLKYL